MTHSNSPLKVSVIVPVYNAENYLRKCLNSIINQSLKDIEIICVNDGSTDNSLEILETYSSEDSRIVIYNQENQGPAKAREIGISISKGEYIGFVDSDDFIDNKYFELLYKNAKKYDADISMTDNVILYSNGSCKKKKCGVSSIAKIVTSADDKAKIIISTGICSNKIYKKSFIEKTGLAYTGHHPGEDNVFTAAAVINADKIAVLHNAKYFYVQVENSIVHRLKDRSSFTIFNNYKYIDEWIDSQINLSETEKENWKYINNLRKKEDFKVFHDTMNPLYKEDFKILADENLRINNLIISLTSYPARINFVSQTIESLLSQTIKAEKIILWLAPEQFPNREDDLPEQLLDLIPKGLSIEWYKDIKSYKKLIPALLKYPGKVIVTADDDIIYAEDWLESLYLAYLKDPTLIHCHRAHKISFFRRKLLPYKYWGKDIKNVKPSFNNFLTGAGGVLYPVNCFYKFILREDLFMQLAPSADDIWFWAMAVLKGTKISVIGKNYSDLTYIEGSQETALWKTNVSENQNDIQMQNILQYFPQIMTKLEKYEHSYSNIYEKLFSVKKLEQQIIITILGIKIIHNSANNKIRTEKYPFESEHILKKLEMIEKEIAERNALEQMKLNTSLIKNDRFPIVNSIIYVPDYPSDYIQRTIVHTGNFYEIKDLKYLDKFLDKTSVILDVGANIGNHTIYWGKRTCVRKIYSFEPVDITYKKLLKNIEINALQNKVITYNVGVSDIISKGRIKVLDTANYGGSSISESCSGDFDIITIDSLDIKEENISLIKVDTEGFEYKVIKGAYNTIKKYKPYIYIEINDNKAEIEDLLSSLGYYKGELICKQNYLYRPL